MAVNDGVHEVLVEVISLRDRLASTYSPTIRHTLVAELEVTALELLAAADALDPDDVLFADVQEILCQSVGWCEEMTADASRLAA